MIVFDFMIFYLSYYFDQNKRLLTWSSPVERACYALGLGSIAVLFSLNQILLYQEFILPKFEISKGVFLIIALALMQLYQYVYVNRGRYDKLISDDRFNSDLNKDRTAIIAICIVAALIISPFAVISILIPN